jgi:hypothetical protein
MRHDTSNVHKRHTYEITSASFSTLLFNDLRDMHIQHISQIVWILLAWPFYADKYHGTLMTTTSSSPRTSSRAFSIAARLLCSR